jgi:hypothetical protein
MGEKACSADETRQRSESATNHRRTALCYGLPVSSCHLWTSYLPRAKLGSDSPHRNRETHWPRADRSSNRNNTDHNRGPRTGHHCPHGRAHARNLRGTGRADALCASLRSHDNCSEGTDTCSEGTDNGSKGTDNCSEGTDNGSKGTAPRTEQLMRTLACVCARALTVGKKREPSPISRAVQVGTLGYSLGVLK